MRRGKTLVKGLSPMNKVRTVVAFRLQPIPAKQGGQDPQVLCGFSLRIDTLQQKATRQ
jgi:hypothetical protein